MSEQAPETDQNIHYIIYASKAVLDPARDVQAQLDDITASSVKNNSERQITGALLYCGGHFLQVLEGQQNDITERFDIIKQDARHTDVKILSHNESYKRRFQGWHMASLILDPDDEIVVNALQDDDDLETQHLSPEAALIMLKAVKELKDQSVIEI